MLKSAVNNIHPWAPSIIASAVVAGGMCAFLLSPAIGILILAGLFGVVAFTLSVHRFSIIFLPLLALRSSLDAFTETGLTLGGVTFNVPAVLSIFLLAGGAIYLLLDRSSVFPPIAVYYGLWLVILIPFVGLNIHNFGIPGVIAVREFTRLGAILMVFLVTYNMVDTENIKRFFAAIMLSLIVPLAVGYYQLATQTGMVLNDVHRIYGTIAHPNSFALFIVLLFGLTYWHWRKDSRKAWLVILLLEFGALVAAVSFNGIIMFVLLLNIILWQENIYFKLSIALTILMLVVVLSQSKQVQLRFQELEGVNFQHNIQHLELADSISWRLATWWHLFLLWEDRPFTGYGLQATNIINPILIPTGEPAEAHNDYLKFLLETGIAGLGIYVLLNVLVATSIFGEYRSARDPQLKRLLFILFAAFISWQIGSLSSNFLRATAFQFYFWAALGAALKCRRLEKAQQITL